MEDVIDTVVGIGITIVIVLVLSGLVNGVRKLVRNVNDEIRRAENQAVKEQTAQRVGREQFLRSSPSAKPKPIETKRVAYQQPYSVENELAGAEATSLSLGNLEADLGGYEVAPHQYHVQNLTQVPAEEGASLLTPDQPSEVEQEPTANRPQAHPLAKLFADRNVLRNSFILNEVLGRRF